MRIKILLSILLGLIFYLSEGIYFNKLDIFNRDLLQFFNNPLNSSIDDRIALVDIDVNTASFSNPLQFSEIELLIKKINENRPKYIILNIEPTDFSQNEKQRRQLYALLEKYKVYLNTITASITHGTNFTQDVIFENYPYSFSYTMAKDTDSGYYSPRRLALQYYGEAQTGLLHSTLSSIGLEVKKIDYFNYAFERMNTKQLFHKYYDSNSFTRLDSEQIVKFNEVTNKLTDKIVLIGRVDEFTFMHAENPFKLTGKPLANSTMKSSIVPLHHILANQINALTKGDYVKYVGLKPINILVYIFFVFLIFFKFNAKTKFLIFILTLPTLILFQILSYALFSFYFDLNSLYTLLVSLQYIVIPIISFLIFKEQKIKQLDEINNVRIDVLLSISEKVAHDIRSPLSAIKLLTSKLQFQNEEQKKIFKNSIDRIEQITENILTKYKTSNGADLLKNTELFLLNDLVKSTIAEKTILEPRIKYSLKSNKEIEITSNKLELSRVLSNIIDNSIHALTTQQKPEITISIILNGKNIEIEIFDNGVGIPNAVLKILGSERFSTKTTQGNGIGLLHAKRSIEQLGGSLSIDSSEGIYTKITLVLPNIDNM